MLYLGREQAVFSRKKSDTSALLCFTCYNNFALLNAKWLQSWIWSKERVYMYHLRGQCEGEEARDGRKGLSTSTKNTQS